MSNPIPCKNCAIILEPLEVIPLKRITVITEAIIVPGKEIISDFYNRLEGLQFLLIKIPVMIATTMATGE